MTTSLAAQLKKLAVPDAQISLGSDFKQASFLYDDVEAAKYDRDHFYNIGVNGLQQLIAKDRRFSKFEDNLFSPSSRSLQRSVQTTEVNKQLDATITTFLLQVSPYMQLREAHKAIEWLVNRFNIHLRNVDAFMMCVLPFHDQEPFIMTLRLLKMNTKECAKWKWLESVKNADTFLPRQTLVTHCRSLNGFLGFMCSMLSRHIEENTDEDGQLASRCLSNVISFFTQTVIGVIMEDTPTEQIISVLIPVLSAGLKSTSLPDYVMSSYMIFSHLLISSNLAHPLLESILNVLCKNVSSGLLPSAMNVITLMYQKQNISKLSKKALRYLIRQPLLPKVLTDLSKEVKLEPFMTPFLAALTHKALKNPNEEIVTSDTNAEDEDVTALPPMSVLSSLLGSASLEKKSVMGVIRSLMTWFVSTAEIDTEMEVDGDEVSKDGPFRLYRLLENKFSKVLEATLLDLSKADESMQMEKVVRNLKMKSVKTAHQELISDPETSLMVCLHHHDVRVRRSAVEQMLMEGEKVLGKDDLRSAILLRLQDEDSRVVNTILEEPERLWKLFEDKRLLYQTLLKKLCSLRGWSISQTHRQILTAICSSLSDDIALTNEITTVVLSFLVPIGQENTALFPQEELLASPLAVSSPLLPSARKMFPKGKKNSEVDFVDFVQNLVYHIAEQVLKSPDAEETQLQKFYDCIMNSPRPGCAALLLLLVNILLIQKAVSEKVKSTFQRQLVTILVDLTSTKKLVTIKWLQDKEEPSDVKTIISCSLESLMKKGRLPVEMFSFCLRELKLGCVPQSLKKMTFWDISKASDLDCEWLWIVMTLFNFLLDLTSHKKSKPSFFIQQIFQNFFKVLEDNKSIVKLMCMIWCNDDVSYQHKAMNLQFAQSYLGSLPAAAKEKLTSDETVPLLPFALVLLSSPSDLVRQAAFNLMADLSNKKDDPRPLFSWFSAHFLQFRQEVEIDMAFGGQVMKNIMEGNADVNPPSPKKRRKSSSKPSTSSVALDFLVNIVFDPATPLAFQKGILVLFQNLDSLECFHPLMGLLDALITDTNQSHPQATSLVKRDLIRLLIKRLTPNVAVCLEERSKSLQTVCSALKCETVVESPGETAQLLVVGQLTRKFMAALPDEGKKCLFSKILDIMTVSTSPEMVRQCRKVVKHMKLDSSLAICEMQTVVGGTQAGTVREAKRKKVQPSADALDKEDLGSLCWKRITLLFEMIQSKKKIINASMLVPVAFQVMAKVLEIESEGSGEYIKQLILTAICKICTSSVEKADAGESDDVVTGDHLNMDLIVQCIRGSNNAHTHHQALLLLSIAAKIAPGLLLHNMMSIFIFMGVNVLRQDNEYSFHVIGRILENVIPAIITACEQKNKAQRTPSRGKKPSASATPTDISTQKSESVMTVILRVFVDAIPHVPSHRRIVLFKKLMSVVGIENYLWRLILLYIESVVKRPKGSGGDFLPEEKSSGPLSAFDLEFLATLSEEFTSIQLFQCVASTLKYIMELPEELKQDDLEKLEQGKKSPMTLDNINVEDMEIFNLRRHTPKQLRHFKYATVYALTELLSSQHLVAELSITDQSHFLPYYQKVLEMVLKLISQFAKSNDAHKDDTSSRFWKISLNKCHDLMENLVTLLPDSMFIEVVSDLMNNSLILVQKRALDLLGSKLQHYKDRSLNQEQRTMLLSMVDKLQKIVQKTLLPKGKVSPKNEEMVNGQTAIYNLKVLCRILGDANHQAFLGVLKLCMEALQRHNDNGMVAASAMLCIAEVMSCAKVHAIEYLGELMPLIITEIQSEEITRHEVLLLASITSLQKIIEALPLFLTPYLADIITKISIISSSLQSQSHKPAIFQKIKLICTTLATVMSTRKFLPALETSMHALQDKLVSCAECLMTMLKDHIVGMSREDLTTFCQDLLKFFFTCFDLRVERKEIDESDMSAIEDLVIEAFISLVFKLSEAQFKPMLFELFTWASDEDADKERLLVFYKLCHRLAEKLKNLFTLFAGHILKHSAEILDVNNKSKTKCKFFGKGKIARRKSCRLLRDVVGCLQKTFAHDTEGFLNKERFDIVMQPIVDQLENELGKPSEAEERVQQFLVPCIASLAAAAHDDILWKDMNYQILLKTRNPSAKVRMWALNVIDAFHKQLGEDYTQLVPETIPFIAELMEDESDEVEKLTQKVIASMEVSVGENLQEYF